MGAIFKQVFVRTTPEEITRWVQMHNIPVVGASPDGQVDYDRVRYRPPLLIVLGTERSGLTEEQRSMCNCIVRIPMVDGIDSLNVGVAGSLLLYQVFRNRADPE